MAKKKSKTQKYKKSQQKKQKKLLKEQGIVVDNKRKNSKKIVDKDEVIYNVAITKPEIIKKKQKEKNIENLLKLEKIDNTKEAKNPLINALNKIEDKLPKKEVKIERVVKPKKVNTKKEKTSSQKEISKIKKEIKNIKEKIKALNLLSKIKNIFKIILTKITLFFKLIFNKLTTLFNYLKNKITLFAKTIKNKIKNKKKKNKVKVVKKKYKKVTQKQEIELPKLKSKKEIKKELPKLKVKNNNIFNNIINFIKNTKHIVFNSIIIVIFLILIIGLIRVKVYSKGTIIYVSSLLLFLILVAISHNKHISGNVFTILLCIGMSFAIYRLEYNYDFINNLNTMKYEYKTYYVVSFDNSLNRSIHNLNNKKIGILKDNEKNIERKLNTKLEKIKYIEYDNLTDMFNDFYSSDFRAVIVTENQYKYLVNMETTGKKQVKILYEFEVNAKK